MGKRFLFLLLVVIFVCSCFSLGWAADMGPINSGETKIGIDLVGPSYMDTWTFTGNVGDQVIINAVTISGALDTHIVLYPPGGGPAEADLW
ncbi:MAG: hypothetical protein HY755_07985 [Nitrospirae bacterium]|nr:hypothetical protein [Nitrospirota bacterium]